VRRLAGELAGLVEAGDLDQACELHDTMGRLLEAQEGAASSPGAQVLAFPLEPAGEVRARPERWFRAYRGRAA
jgi:hypothetical protein